MCLYAAFPASSLNVKIFKLQSLSTVVLKSTTSPSISPAHAALPSPPEMSNAMSFTVIGSEYSLTEPSFKVIFIFTFSFTHLIIISCKPDSLIQ